MLSNFIHQKLFIDAFGENAILNGSGCLRQFRFSAELTFNKFL